MAGSAVAENNDAEMNTLIKARNSLCTEMTFPSAVQPRWGQQRTKLEVLALAANTLEAFGGNGISGLDRDDFAIELSCARAIARLLSGLRRC